MIELRGYQEKIITDVYAIWSQGIKKVIAVCPTGGGKTKILAKLAHHYRGSSCVIAHRQELVYQIAMTWAEFGIFHRIIAPDKLIKFISNRQRKIFGRSFVHPDALAAVAGVDTLNARHAQYAEWMAGVGLVMQDEGHHVLEGNKWGIALKRFANAWLLGVSATPTRADRKSLKLGSGGLYEAMVHGPEVRELMDRGYLTDYVIYGPPPAIDLSAVDISKATGDFNQHQLRDAAHKSTVTGDVVEQYFRVAPGKLGAAFLVDVEQAAETSQRFNAAGLPAKLITSNTPDDLRVKIMDDFRAGLVKMITNVDIIGEGVDVPGIEIVCMGRPTESLPLYRQQAGRAFRPAEGKSHGIINDHVGNVLRHGLPDKPMAWSLDDPLPRRRRAGADGEIVDENEQTNCRNPQCLRTYPRVKPKCPHCGNKPVPVGRDRPEQVDGDLTEYSGALLAALGREADRIVGPAQVSHASVGAQIGSYRNHMNRAAAQIRLRESIDQWAGVEVEVFGRDWPEAYRVFYARFGIDVATAKTLGAADATKLYDKIWADINLADDRSMR